MSPKRTYFGFFTPQQRKLLFEKWEATDSVTEACQTAHLSRGLFYYWKASFVQHGYAGLGEFDNRVAHKLNYKSASIEQQRVTEMWRQNPDWGKVRIAQEMAKANNWVPLVSPNTVGRMLQAAGLWPGSAARGKETLKQ
jgi:hypothetical protein